MNEIRAQLTETNRAVLSNIAEELKLNKKWEEKATEKAREESAIEALKLGLDIEVTSKISKLSLEKVRELAKKLS